MDIKQHTVKSYDKDLQSISETLFNMVNMVDESINIVTEAIKDPQKPLLEKLRKHDYKINQLDNLVEKQVTAMLALRQPMAFDLRYIVSALKVSSNLERMGDNCKTIAKKVAHFNNDFDEKVQNSFLEMIKIAREMTADAVNSFNNHDQSKALIVLQRDDEIDAIYHNLFYVAKGENFNQEQVHNIVNILFIAKSLERLADHATNIADTVQYVASGEIAD